VTDIERWTIYLPNDLKGFTAVHVRPGHGQPDEHGYMRVEVVPASELRTAVDALLQIAQHPELGGTGHPADAIARNTLDALTVDPNRRR
jgi:hypothetical protein